MEADECAEQKSSGGLVVELSSRHIVYVLETRDHWPMWITKIDLNNPELRDLPGLLIAIILLRWTLATRDDGRRGLREKLGAKDTKAWDEGDILWRRNVT